MVEDAGLSDRQMQQCPWPPYCLLVGQRPPAFQVRRFELLDALGARTECRSRPADPPAPTGHPRPAENVSTSRAARRRTCGCRGRRTPDRPGPPRPGVHTEGRSLSCRLPKRETRQRGSRGPSPGATSILWSPNRLNLLPVTLLPGRSGVRRAASPASATRVTLAPGPAPAEASIRMSPMISTIVSLVQPAGFARRCFQVGPSPGLVGEGGRDGGGQHPGGLARFEPALSTSSPAPCAAATKRLGQLRRLAPAAGCRRAPGSRPRGSGGAHPGSS